MAARANRHRRHGALPGLALAAAALAGPGLAVEAAATAATATAPMRTVGQTAEEQLLGLINDYRRARHAPPLTGQRRLQAAAAWYAADMARNDSFSHTHVDSLGRPPEDRFRQFGYRWAVAEVSASGPTTPTSALADWKASPGHNAILIDPRFHQVGVGIGFDPQTPHIYFWAVSLGTGPGARTSLTILVEPPHHRRHALRLRRAHLSSRPQLPELALPRARSEPNVPAERAIKATQRRRAAWARGRTR